MKKQHIINMVSKLLEIAADEIVEGYCCDDLSKNFYGDMTKQEIKELHHEFHKWNNEFKIYAPGSTPKLWSLMTFFSEYIKNPDNF